MIKSGLLAMSSVCLFASFGHADELYVEAGYEFQTVKTDAGNFSPRMGIVSLGYRIREGISLEGSLGSGLSDDTDKGVMLETDSLRALGLRLQSSTAEQLSYYLFAGAVEVDFASRTAEEEIEPTGESNGYQVSVGVNQRLESTPSMQWNLSGSLYDVEDAVDFYGVRLGVRFDY